MFLRAWVVGSWVMLIGVVATGCGDDSGSENPGGGQAGPGSDSGDGRVVVIDTRDPNRPSDTVDGGEPSGVDGGPPVPSDASNGGTSPDSGPTTPTPDGGAGDATSQPDSLTLAAPRLVSPAQAATEIATRSELCWEPIALPAGVSSGAVRYHVVLDDAALATGVLGEEGFAGPCTGELDFNFEQTYEWYVVAFEVASPMNESAPSDTWSFTTTDDGQARTLFTDDFDTDSGWTVSGNATSGAWTRGTPVAASHVNAALGGTQVSQPGRCAAGDRCFFTGQNPSGQATNQDVAGGSTVLLSPAFDLQDVATATVSLSRFFYRSAVNGGGATLRVEILLSDASGGDERAFVLEELPSDAGSNTNTWTPMTYSTCGLPMAERARLRITATDLGSGVLESAIDSVQVTGFRRGDPCMSGPGSLCDPNAADPCGAGLVCCAQGKINTGLFRCEEPVRGFAWGQPPPAPGAPLTGALGCDAPDLFVRRDLLDLSIETRFFGANDCALAEGCVRGTGNRRLLRFSTATPNIGSRDLLLGVPSNHPDLFNYSACHAHHHFDSYASYALLDGQGETVAVGHKQAFCLLDWSSWAWPSSSQSRYTCSNQGISAGWQDVYDSSLDCQWIDITGVPAGSYTLRIAVNAPPAGTDTPVLIERDYSNNTLDVPVNIP